MLALGTGLQPDQARDGLIEITTQPASSTTGTPSSIVLNNVSSNERSRARRCDRLQTFGVEPPKSLEHLVEGSWISWPPSLKTSCAASALTNR